MKLPGIFAHRNTDIRVRLPSGDTDCRIGRDGPLCYDNRRTAARWRAVYTSGSRDPFAGEAYRKKGFEVIDTTDDDIRDDPVFSENEPTDIDEEEKAR